MQAEHSNKKVYWKCGFCKHSWLATINQRVQGRCGCPQCKNRR
ncbi:MAG: zinc-ribbon domain-containing protein [Lachnospiraceae bacterium]|nr:zinc-ribbon domain-containing protein [Lachnospiraceae bacterium]